MDRIRACIKTVFPDCDTAAVRPETRLGDIDGWDSMTGVNLVLELETAFAVSLTGQFLKDDQTIADVVALLFQRGATVDLGDGRSGLRRAS